MSDFPAFGKIPRYFRELVITEKIDGTNGLVHIENVPGSEELAVRAGSRNRWITPKDDNAGFAKWVHENAAELARVLGPGHHYGEWWGLGIQRRYGLTEKRFSLFNSGRWSWEALLPVPGLHVVPVLEEGTGEWAIDSALSKLRREGSFAAPGFDRPEGVVIYHTAARTSFKVTLEGDLEPKSVAPAIVIPPRGLLLAAA